MYADTRGLLADELGVDPRPGHRGLGDPGLPGRARRAVPVHA
ncbi:hypothetical protein, partial [Streptomyces sanglieri]